MVHILAEFELVKYVFFLAPPTHVVLLCTILSGCVVTGNFKGEVTEKSTRHPVAGVEISLHCYGEGSPVEEVLFTNLEGAFKSPKIDCISNMNTTFLVFEKQGYITKRLYFTDWDRVRNSPDDRIAACDPPESVPCHFFSVVLEPVARIENGFLEGTPGENRFGSNP
jgi:hypothetical protein